MSVCTFDFVAKEASLSLDAIAVDIGPTEVLVTPPPVIPNTPHAAVDAGACSRRPATMLSFTRRVGEGVVFGDDPRLIIVAVRGDEVRIAVVPPDPK